MPIRQRTLKLEEKPQDPGLTAPVLDLWEKLCLHEDCCPFCNCKVERSTFPWRYKHHSRSGIRTGNNGTTAVTGSVCPGSRNVYTLLLLGLGDAVL